MRLTRIRVLHFFYGREKAGQGSLALIFRPPLDFAVGVDRA